MMKEFLLRLRECRNKKGLTQKAMAQLLNTDERLYRRYELGESEPTLSRAVQIADVLDVSLDYLTGRVDEP